MVKTKTYEELEQVVEDLTKETAQLKRSEEAFKESGKRYRHLIESAHDMIQNVKPWLH